MAERLNKSIRNDSVFFTPSKCCIHVLDGVVCNLLAILFFTPLHEIEVVIPVIIEVFDLRGWLYDIRQSVPHQQKNSLNFVAAMGSTNVNVAPLMSSISTLFFSILAFGSF